MKNVFKQMAVACLAVTCSWAVVSHAADDTSERSEKRHERSAEKMEKRLEKMTEELELTETQVILIKAIFEDSKADRQAVREQMKELREQGLDKETIREQLKPQHEALREQTQAEILAVLSSDQATKIQEHWAKKEAKRAEGKGKRRGKHQNDEES